LAWAVVPLLAVLAYLAVLRIGFLSDDFLTLITGRNRGLNPRILMPDPDWMFYRPISTVLTWGLGWRLWGDNPFPYHLLGLLLHAGVALTLGLWLATVSRRASLGRLAGALFAMFPLHTEAVGWLAAQWDLWAALFGLAALWLFTRWWSGSGCAAIYLAALVCWGLGVFSKESVIPLLPLFALSVWAAPGRLAARDWRRLGGVLVPFALVVGMNFGIRLATWGTLGGYAGGAGDRVLFWDQTLNYMHLLLAPLNALVFGDLVVQIVGAVTSLLLLAGLIRYGNGLGRLLALSGAWIALTLAPVLNLPVGRADLQNNRFLYLAAAGYCVALALLLRAALAAPGARPRLVRALIAGLLVISGLACWVQLQPWHTATARAEGLIQTLHRLIPPGPHKDAMTWYVENLPDSYRGASMFRLGFDVARYFADGDLPRVEPVPSAAQVDLAAAESGGFALRFATDEVAGRAYIGYAAGITAARPPPSTADAGADLQLWDFRACDDAVLGAWEIRQARAACEWGQGLAILASRGDPQLMGPNLALPVDSGAAQFVRLRVAVRYPGQDRAPGRRVQWFWAAPGADWAAARSAVLPIKPDGLTHVYWTFVPAAAGDTVSRLRFDPVDDSGPATVEWIAVDWVK
jgi:hypothetical protein